MTSTEGASTTVLSPETSAFFLLHIGDPRCRQLEYRLNRRHTFERGFAVVVAFCVPVIRHELPLADCVALQEKAVFVGAELQIVARSRIGRINTPISDAKFRRARHPLQVNHRPYAYRPDPPNRNRVRSAMYQA